MNTSYHVHTRWSDGEGEIGDLVAAAGDLGLDEVGFSDHYVLRPDGLQVSWSMALDELDAYVNEVQSATNRSGQPPAVRLGLEVDYFPETADAIADLIAMYPFDYVIGSVHIVDGFPIDEGARNWETLTEDQRNLMIQSYWSRIREMIESGIFDIVGHLDLTKKFGFRPTADMSAEVSAALDAVADADLAVEVNTAGWHAPCREVYPDPSIIRGCFDRGVPVTVTADTHAIAHLTRSYGRAFELLGRIGYREVVCFAGRRRTSRRIGA